MPVYWLEQTAADVPASDDWLGERERITLAGLLIAKRRADWRLGRWTAKRAIAAHLAVPLHDIEVLPAASGAPRAFVRGIRARLRLSISHSHGVACCALNDGLAALGCDIERIEPRDAAFRNDYFTAGERAAVAAWPRGCQDTAVTLLWCAKESVLKAFEVGLRADPIAVDITPSFTPVSGNSWAPLRARIPGYPSMEGFWRADGFFVRTVIESSNTDWPP